MQDQDFRRIVEASLHYSRAPGTRPGDFERIVDYLQSPGSGPGNGVSFATHMHNVMQQHASSLPEDRHYAFYSGKSPAHRRNVDLAFDYFRHTAPRTGWDTRTGLAAYFDAADADLRDVDINTRFAKFLADNKLGVSPFAATDILRNTMAIANCERYSMHAASCGRPIIAFVHGARSTDVFARLELPHLLKNPDAIINGYPVRAISGDPLEFVGRAAAEMTAMESRLHREVSQNSGRFVSLAEFRRVVDPIAGYDALEQTVFGRPLQSAQRMTLDQLAAASTQWRLPPPAAARLPFPGGVPGVLGWAALATEARIAAVEAQRHVAVGNHEAAQSTYRHFGARMGGGWLGGALAGAAAGSATGPGVIAFAGLGAIAGSEIGGRLADWWDEHKLSHQVDADGVQWRYDGRAWTRSMVLDLTNDGRDNPVPSVVQATLEKARELNYRASGTAVQLALGKLPAPGDPYRLPASAGDVPSLQPAAWIRDPVSAQWSRNAIVDIRVSGALVHQPEVAGAERAARLDRQAEQVIADNIRSGPLAYQARYLLAYHANGWQRFGPIPAAVALRDQPSDRRLGAEHTLSARAEAAVFRDQDQHKASTSMQAELGRTQAVAAQLQQALARRIQVQPAWQAPTPEQARRDELQYRYGTYGVDLSADWREAILRATARTLEHAGLQDTAMLHPVAANDGRITADSTILHLVGGKVAAVTSRREIIAAWNQVRSRQAGARISDEAPGMDAAAGRRSPGTEIESTGRRLDSRKNLAEAQAFQKPAAGDRQALRLDDPRHRDHPLYQSMLEQLRMLGGVIGHVADPERTNLAAALASRAKLGGIGTDGQLLAGNDLRTLFVVGPAQNTSALQTRVHVDLAVARATPIEHSSRAIEPAQAHASAEPGQSSAINSQLQAVQLSARSPVM